MLNQLEHKSSLIRFFPFVLVSLIFFPSLQAEPYISPKLSERMKSLPYAVHEKNSFPINAGLINSVDFSGAAYGGSLVGEAKWMTDRGTWIEMKNLGPESWANATLTFKRPLNISRYNSLVLWVKSTRENTRFWIDMQNPGWSSATPQARTDTIPAGGLANQCVQIVIPFESIYSEFRFSLKEVERIVFEFGHDTTGNPKGASIQVLGMAFVAQTEAPSTVLIITPEASVRSVSRGRRRRRLVPNYIQTVVPPAYTTDHAVTQVIPARPEPASIEDLQPADDVSSQPAEEPEDNRRSITSVPEPAFNFSETAGKAADFVRRKARRWYYKTRSYFRGATGLTTLWILIGLLGLTCFLLLLRKKSKPAVVPRKTFMQLTKAFPVLPPSATPDKKKIAAVLSSGAPDGWISPFMHSIERNANDDHFGETFLRRQIEAGAAQGLHLYPSLCFARTMYSYEAFLDNPDLYLTRTIPLLEVHLSDQELKARYPSYFPIWIPPVRQNQHGLNQRVLAAYGRMPGSIINTDYIQYDLTSAQLRDLAARVIERFVKIGGGVRIEGAAAMLNSGLARYWGNQLKSPPSSEFWPHVIARVRSKFPNAVLIADAAGADAEALLGMGFNQVENDRLREIMINQIRLKEVGGMETSLAESVTVLPKSIYNVAPLLDPSHSSPVAARQNKLALMILSLLPGRLGHPDLISPLLADYLNWLTRVFQTSADGFHSIPSSSSAVLAFARSQERTLHIIAANFSTTRQDVFLKPNGLIDHFDTSKLYLFNDALHGTAFLSDLPVDTNGSPAIAILGHDLRASGLNVSLDPVSLRIFTVNMTRAIINGTTEKIRQLYKD